AIADANGAIQQATAALTTARPELAAAEATAADRPGRIRKAEQDHGTAVEKAARDAEAEVVAADNLRIATEHETDAQEQATEAAAEVARREKEVVDTVTAQIQAAADQMASTAALPGLSSDVHDSAPTPEQS
ncbi:hypothetical protein, partial [Streptomyces sp. MBT53]|uniref:hypothetical protein n=1 Tax=Streptomyces sp. MBT53 TaxID=1488384 RepID=UPI0019113954